MAPWRFTNVCVLIFLLLFIYYFILLCSPPNRPHYGSYPSVQLFSKARWAWNNQFASFERKHSKVRPHNVSTHLIVFLDISIGFLLSNACNSNLPCWPTTLSAPLSLLTSTPFLITTLPHAVYALQTPTCCLLLVFALSLPAVVDVLQLPQSGTHSDLAFATLPLYPYLSSPS